MDKELFAGLLAGIREAAKVKRGEKQPSRVFEYTALDVKNIRLQLGYSQQAFSELVLVSIKTLQNWEQGRRHPQGPALALLTILRNDPKHAIKALHQVK